MKSKAAVTALVLLLLTLGSEANVCSITSPYEECIDTVCAAACTLQNYTSGYCRGIFISHCTCFKDCGSEGGGYGGGKAPPPEDDGGTVEDKPMALTARARRAGGHA
ncbi:hypothetical protein EJB05_11706, partial [Eragrostis curvula]